MSSFKVIPAHPGFDVYEIEYNDDFTEVVRRYHTSVIAWKVDLDEESVDPITCDPGFLSGDYLIRQPDGSYRWQGGNGAFADENDVIRRYWPLRLKIARANAEWHAQHRMASPIESMVRNVCPEEPDARPSPRHDDPELSLSLLPLIYRLTGADRFQARDVLDELKVRPKEWPFLGLALGPHADDANWLDGALVIAASAPVPKAGFRVVRCGSIGGSLRWQITKV
jgi:hypothetical protein